MPTNDPPERSNIKVSTTKRRFLTDIHIRAPARLAEAITHAADRNMTTSSEYIRQAIIYRLTADKLTLQGENTAAPSIDGTGAIA